MASARIKDTDKGYAKLTRAVFGFRKPKVTVGVHAEDGAASHGDATTVLDVAIANEFGTETIPERSFIRAWVDEHRDEARGWLAVLMAQVVAGKITREIALERWGQKIQGEIQKRIAQGIPPPNAPETIARKGSSTPLIDTGQLRSSIRYKVESGK